jgi:ketosteroid isomerase-like protein
MAETPDEQEIKRALHDLNQAWVKGHPEQIAKYLHPQIVFASPDLKQRMLGREDCVATYVDFCSQATIHSFNESGYAIDVIGNTAVATYAFEIDYEMNGNTSHETGHDLFVFAREGGGWKAVWRTQVGAKG